MTSAFDARFLERLLRADVAALRDPQAIAEAGGKDELACVAFERAGMLRRVAGAIPEDCERALADEAVLAAALRFLETVSLEPRLDELLAAAAPLGEGPDEDELARAEAPETVALAEALFLHRDRLQAALGEIARHVAAARAAGRAPERGRGFARSVAHLARLDARLRAKIDLFYPVIPLIRELKKRFDWTRLDREAYWWWHEIEASFDAVAAAPARGGAAEAVRASLGEEGRRCVEDLDDVENKRAAFAIGEDFPGRGAFAAHLLRCGACRAAVAELERLLEGRGDLGARELPGPAETSLALAAAPVQDQDFEEVRARSFRPRARIPKTRWWVAIGLRERDRLRFTFTTEDGARARDLDGAIVRVESLGRATVANGAAEIPLPTDRPLEEVAAQAFGARRTLVQPDGAVIHLP